MITVTLPSVSRAFPTILKYILPLRYSMKLGRQHLHDGCLPSIVGHTPVINEYVSTPESIYADALDSEMVKVVSKLPVGIMMYLLA